MRRASPTGIFDYIIVGAGSAGCVLAERLTADGRDSVLLIEAGGPDRHPMIHIPKGIARIVHSPDHTWTYPIPQAEGSARPTEYWIRGRGLGGSSSINGMIYIRGNPADFDAWEALGATGWNANSMRDAFRAIEDYAVEADEVHGRDGPLHVTPGAYRYPMADRLIEAGAQMGFPIRDDFNGPVQEGVGYYANNIRRGRRQSAAVAFLNPARKRGNLHVMTDRPIARVLFEGGRAVGVTTQTGETYRCRGEVILCAGAIESPALLQASGIGPRDMLAPLGIDVVAHSPDVGTNLAEHFGMAISWRLKGARGLERQYRGLGLIGNMARYCLTRGGPLATGPYEIGAFLRSSDAVDRPDVQLHMSAFAFADLANNNASSFVAIDPEPSLSAYGHLVQPTSRGRIGIADAARRMPLHIEPNWLSTETDQRAAIALVRLIRRYMTMPAIAPFIARELGPGIAIQSDEDILATFRRLAVSGLHGTGTCRMGTDDRAVVDPQARVRGVDGLRVVDCSIMPGPITGNTNAAAMATAWRAAALIRQERRAAA